MLIQNNMYVDTFHTRIVVDQCFRCWFCLFSFHPQSSWTAYWRNSNFMGLSCCNGCISAQQIFTWQFEKWQVICDYHLLIGLFVYGVLITLHFYFFDKCLKIFGSFSWIVKFLSNFMYVVNSNFIILTFIKQFLETPKFPNQSLLL